jgi:sulfite exporter TauE/SafE/copper chaperone CopZ
MTCVNCQNKIETRLRNTAGVIKADVSFGEGTADVTYDADVISLRGVCSVIEKLTYAVLADGERGGPDIKRTIGLLALIAALYVPLWRFGVLNALAPGRLAGAETGYGMMFVIGLLTSVHCAAMCGGINLSQCVPRGEDACAGGKASALRPAFLYNLGRTISYTAAGFILGAAGFIFGGGADAGVPPLAQGIVKLIAGVFMIAAGINMLGIFPWLRRIGPRTPEFLSRIISGGKARRKSPLIVGLLNGLMPCGPLQSIQIAALASGRPFAGALSMFLFSLGTAPLMLGLGSAAAALGRKFTGKATTAGAMLVVVLGLAMLSQGGALSGLIDPELLLAVVIALCAIGIAASLPFKTPSHRALGTAGAAALAVIILAAPGGVAPGGAADFAEAELENGTQVVTSTLSSGKYPNIAIQAGIPVKWIINAPQGSVNGCNYQINIPEFGVSAYNFKTGANIIEFAPAREGRFQYSCWMGMISGAITVTQGPSASG